MNLKNSLHLSKTVFHLLGAAGASVFVALPVLAQVNSAPAASGSMMNEGQMECPAGYRLSYAESSVTANQSYPSSLTTGQSLERYNQQGREVPSQADSSMNTAMNPANDSSNRPIYRVNPQTSEVPSNVGIRQAPDQSSAEPYQVTTANPADQANTYSQATSAQPGQTPDFVNPGSVNSGSIDQQANNSSNSMNSIDQQANNSSNSMGSIDQQANNSTDSMQSMNAPINRISREEVPSNVGIRQAPDQSSAEPYQATGNNPADQANTFGRIAAHSNTAHNSSAMTNRPIYRLSRSTAAPGAANSQSDVQYIYPDRSSVDPDTSTRGILPTDRSTTGGRPLYRDQQVRPEESLSYRRAMGIPEQSSNQAYDPNNPASLQSYQRSSTMVCVPQ